MYTSSQFNINYIATLSQFVTYWYILGTCVVSHGLIQEAAYHVLRWWIIDTLWCGGNVGL